MNSWWDSRIPIPSRDSLPTRYLLDCIWGLDFQGSDQQTVKTWVVSTNRQCHQHFPLKKAISLWTQINSQISWNLSEPRIWLIKGRAIWLTVVRSTNYQTHDSISIQSRTQIKLDLDSIRNEHKSSASSDRPMDSQQLSVNHATCMLYPVCVPRSASPMLFGCWQSDRIVWFPGITI